MKKKAEKYGIDIKKQQDAFLFTMLYERWSEVDGTSIDFKVTREDPKFNAEAKSNIDINKTTQTTTLRWSGIAAIGLQFSEDNCTGKQDIQSPNGSYTVHTRSQKCKSDMSLNTHLECYFAVKYDGNRATHSSPIFKYKCPDSGGCARTKTIKFAAIIWTFSQENITTVNVHGIWPGHKK